MMQSIQMAAVLGLLLSLGWQLAKNWKMLTRPPTEAESLDPEAIEARHQAKTEAIWQTLNNFGWFLAGSVISIFTAEIRALLGLPG